MVASLNRGGDVIVAVDDEKKQGYVISGFYEDVQKVRYNVCYQKIKIKELKNG